MSVDARALAAGVPRWELDWRRLGRRALLGAIVLLAATTLYRNALQGEAGWDFHGGIWQAAQDLLHGRSPYLTPDWRALLHASNAFITPPPLAVLAIPLSVLPFVPATVLWNLLCLGALLAALWIVDVRDWKLYLLAACSFPFVASVALGQPDGLFALALAVAWRRRGSWVGALAAGALIAAKLLAWPLVLWLLVTRRLRSSLVAMATAAGLLLGSWALIGFQGLAEYPRLLSADARAFEDQSHSVTAAAMRLGASARLGQLVAVACAVAIATLIVWVARGSDRGWFVAAIAVGLLVSPILWTHYLLALLVALAIARPRLDRAWLLTLAFWLSPAETSPGWQIWVVLIAACALAVVAARPTPAERPSR
ncbi:MAG: DUF2029 domain-containing protein [Solirubrobacterales bacterium]|nr:DUF2029 domain-containing protein [Solirubrobacterales bacterium]